MKCVCCDEVQSHIFSLCHRMTGNLTAEFFHNGSVFPPPFPAASASPPPWEAPSFTVAARCRVAATLALFVFAAVSNLSVLISVCWGRGYRLAAHLRPLISGLACADLVMTFVVMPLDAVWNVTVQWYAGDVMCKLLCFLKLFAMHSAAFILVVVSLDRYRAILHPLDSLDAGHRNRRMLSMAWTLSLLLASPQVRQSEGYEFRCYELEDPDLAPVLVSSAQQEELPIQGPVCDIWLDL